MTKQTKFEKDVNSVLAEGAAQRKLDAAPPAVDNTNAELRKEWAKVGVPLRERLEEIGRTPRFKKALELSDSLDSLLALGYNRERIGLVVESARRGTLLHNRALAQLTRVEAKIVAGMNPSEEPEYLHGGKGSDIVRYELKSIAHADREIEQHLTQCETHFGALLVSLKKATKREAA